MPNLLRKSRSVGIVLLAGCLSISCDSSDPVVDGGTVVDSGGTVVDSGGTVVDSGGTVVDSGGTVVDSGSLDASFLTGVWISGCDVIASSSAMYCTTFSGTNGYASRTKFFAASTTCAGASTIIPGSGTYALAGPATTPSEATKVDVVIQGFGPRFSILARDGAKLKFGKEDSTNDGTSDAKRYQRYMEAPATKGVCPF